MSTVVLRPYVSPTLVLLAFDWAEGSKIKNFLGFAISRTPGYRGQSTSWLPNRIGFNGPSRDNKDFPSNECPIQKFYWWDARIDTDDRGKTYVYKVTPITGTPDDLFAEEDATATATIKIPFSEDGPIGTYFNRAVVSSQAFSKQFGRSLSGENLHKALTWLANGMETVIPAFVKSSPSYEGTIYHLNDTEWIIPAMEEYPGRNSSIVYNNNVRDGGVNDEAVERLGDKIEFRPRTRTAIMHNKFLVTLENGRPTRLVTGSANYTTGGIATQANVIHTFDSPELAKLYLERKRLLEDDPTKAATAEEASWSKKFEVGDATIRVFFPPEATRERVSIDTVVRAVQKAKSSVLFCLFKPTDKELMQAIFDAGDAGKMMLGLVNSIPRQEPDGSKKGQEVTIDIYHRSKKDKDVFSHGLLPKNNHPQGFWWETSDLPGMRAQFPVYIHHKFVVIDGHDENPTIFVGSDNMSNNAIHNNDENLLEITNCPRLGQIYVAEFMRLYEHYRARVAWTRWHHRPGSTFRLVPNSNWAKASYTRGTSQYKSRITMAKEIAVE
jgi:hypothetical protein